MQRPLAVTVIGCFFLVAGVYLCAISAVILIAPGAVQTLKVLPLVFVLRLVSPYTTLIVGTVWAIVAWGLFQLRDWARFVATLVLGAGAAWMFVTLLLHHHSIWRMLLACFEIIWRLAAVWYLLTPSAIDLFNAKETSSPSLSKL
jgi:hypothetical protein